MRTQSLMTRWIGAAVLAFAAAGAWAQSLGWQQLPGAAVDVGVGGPNNTAWVIGTNAEGGGYGIYRWNGTNNWDKIPGSAVRIDVDPKGNAWVINAQGGIYRYNGSAWEQLPGSAKGGDIGIGNNGAVWITGGGNVGGGLQIYRWNGSNWTNVPGGALRIDVDPQGNPWVVNSSHNIFRGNGSSWQQMPGAANDIGIGADGSVFVVGTDSGVYKWNGSNWTRMDGGLTDISVDNKGRPWGVNSGRQIYAAGGSQVQVAAATPTPAPTPTPAGGGATADKVRNAPMPPGKTNPLLALVTYNPKGPPLSSADTQAVINWIGKMVASTRQDYCYKQSYGRGAGYPLNTCPGGQEMDAGLCYNRCNAGYGAAGPVCWQYCPSGYTDTGALCHYSAKSLTASLVRSGCHLEGPWGIGCIIPAYDCPSGYTNVGAFCALNTPSVPPGYSGLTGLDLTKKSYGRGVGQIPGCAAGQEKNGLLCYPNCNPGMYGVGPVCWQSCPSGKTDCAAGCASSSTSCGSNTFSMVLAPITLAANIITAGTAGEALNGWKGAIQTGAKFLSERTTLTEVVATANATYQAYNATSMWVNDFVGDFAQLTSADINNQITNNIKSPAAQRYVKEQYSLVHLGIVANDNATKQMLAELNAVSGFDPTGVTGVVSAFAKPICATNEAFPKVAPRY
jgi:hypothetical protein